jgi:hypothetical protein
MAGFALRKIAIIEIEIPDKSTIKKRRAIWSRFATAYQRALIAAAEIVDLVFN